MNDEPIFTQAAHDAAVANAVAAARRDLEAQHAAAIVSANAEALIAGAGLERRRIQAILASDAAKGRGALASHFALATDMAPEAAAIALAAAATEAPAGGSRMALVPTPNLTAGPGGAPDPHAAQAAIDSDYATIAAKLNKQYGAKR